MRGPINFTFPRPCLVASIHVCVRCPVPLGYYIGERANAPSDRGEALHRCKAGDLPPGSENLPPAGEDCQSLPPRTVRAYTPQSFPPSHLLLLLLIPTFPPPPPPFHLLLTFSLLLLISSTLLPPVHDFFCWSVYCCILLYIDIAQSLFCLDGNQDLQWKGHVLHITMRTNLFQEPGQSICFSVIVTFDFSERM